ncbi:MAG: sulfite exporter TauE/SafE family protein [Clostridia bacterium]|nr:sulfite exporter TauE/SafE family protein [Clostridia bacterium]
MIKKIVIGFIAGIVSGLFATGGGMIVVPALVYLLSVEERKARAISLFVILPMVITSGIFYYKNDYIDWKIGILCAIGGMIGGFLGSKYLNKIPTIYLKLSFTIFLIYVSIRMIIS